MGRMITPLNLIHKKNDFSNYPCPLVSTFGNKKVMNPLPTSLNTFGLSVIAMRHGVRTNRLGRPADQRKAIIRSLVTQVLTHGSIKTTSVRANYVRKFVDKMITLSKNGGIRSRRP